MAYSFRDYLQPTKKLNVAGQAGSKKGSGAQFHLIILHERVSFQPDVGGSGAELLGEWLTVGQPRFSRSVTFRPRPTTTLHLVSRPSPSSQIESHAAFSFIFFPGL